MRRAGPKATGSRCWPCCHGARRAEGDRVKVLAMLSRGAPGRRRPGQGCWPCCHGARRAEGDRVKVVGHVVTGRAGPKATGSRCWPCCHGARRAEGDRVKVLAMLSRGAPASLRRCSRVCLTLYVGVPEGLLGKPFPASASLGPDDCVSRPSARRSGPRR